MRSELNTPEMIYWKLKRLGCSPKQIDFHVSQLRHQQQKRKAIIDDETRAKLLEEVRKQRTAAKRNVVNSPHLRRRKRRREDRRIDTRQAFTGLDPFNPHDQYSGVDMSVAPWE
jgi:hypothetical protein